MGEIKVSIFCLTYNHKEYIKQALEGFLMQKCSFDYDIFIYDDASTDGTSDLVKEYANKYPEKIRIQINKNNCFNNADNFERQSELRSSLKGEYIAICEGDDYWLDENKLERQVEFMEKHPECSLLMHNALWLDGDTGESYAGNPFKADKELRKIEIKELIAQKNGHPPTASFLYRKKYEKKPDMFHYTSIMDLPTQLFCALQGDVVYDSRIMSAYRWHSAGSYNRMTQTNLNHRTYFVFGVVEFLLAYNRLTEGKYKDVINSRIQGFLSAYLEDCDGIHQVKQNIKHATEAGKTMPKLSEATLSKLEYLENLLHKKDYLGGPLEKYVAEKSPVWIMGAGKYAEIITKKFELHQINVEGYVVSKLGKTQQFLGKGIISLKEYASKSRKSKLVIAINPINREELMQWILEYKIESYYNPFWIEWDE